MPSIRPLPGSSVAVGGTGVGVLVRVGGNEIGVTVDADVGGCNVAEGGSDMTAG